MKKKWVLSKKYQTIPEMISNKTNLPMYKVMGEGNYQIPKLNGVRDLILSKKKEDIITIVGDYDCDGVFSSSILYLMLKELGFKNVEVALPRRLTEGYGLSEKILSRIQTEFIICVDNGITAVETIQKAKNMGATVVVLDHHLLRDDKKTPNADILIDCSAFPEDIVYTNPNGQKEETSFSSYCGAGISYKLAEVMLPGNLLLKKLISMAAIATIADVMPLVEDNHRIVREGLKSLETYEGRTSGLYALLEALELRDVISAENVGYKIAPCINAVGRLHDEGAMKGFQLVVEEDLTKARGLATSIVENNDKRKKLSALYEQKATQYLLDNGCHSDAVLCINLPNTPEGLLGIIAGKMTEEFQKPCIVVTNNEQGFLKGSGRSLGEYHLKEMLDKCSSCLLGFGGHKAAAGLSMTIDKFTVFHDMIQRVAVDYPTVKDVDTIFYDFEISPNQIEEYLTELDKYSPYGEGNPIPIFKITDCKLQPVQNAWFKQMNADGLKVWLTNGVDALSFGISESYFDADAPKEINLIGTLSVNYFKGKSTNQIMFEDFEEVVSNDTNIYRNLLAQRAAMRNKQ